MTDPRACSAVLEVEAPPDADALGEPSRDVLRSRRTREVRAVTLSDQRTPKRALTVIREDADAIERELGDIVRPRTRGDCVDGPRPCPWVGCRYNLFVDVNPETGSLKLNFPDLEDPSDLPSGSGCALDVADGGGATLELAGDLLNVTRERIRQLETKALQRGELLRLLRRFVPTEDGSPAPLRSVQRGGKYARTVEGAMARGDLDVVPEVDGEIEDDVDVEDDATAALPPVDKEAQFRARVWQRFERIGRELAAGGHLPASPDEVVEMIGALLRETPREPALLAACADPLCVVGAEDVRRAPDVETRDAVDPVEIDAWSNEVVALMRAGMRLRDAIPIASEPLEGPAVVPARPAARPSTPPPARLPAPRARPQPPPVPARAPEERPMSMTEATRAMRERIVEYLESHGPSAPRVVAKALRLDDDERSGMTHAFRTLVQDGKAAIHGRAAGSQWILRGQRPGSAPKAPPARKPDPVLEAAREAAAPPPPPSTALARPDAPAPIVHASLPTEPVVPAGSWAEDLLRARRKLVRRVELIDQVLAAEDGDAAR